MGGGQWAVGSQKPKAQSSLLTASNVVKHDLHLVGIEEAVGVVPAGGMEGCEEVGMPPQVAVKTVQGRGIGIIIEEGLCQLCFSPDTSQASLRYSFSEQFALIISHIFSYHLIDEQKRIGSELLAGCIMMQSLKERTQVLQGYRPPFLSASNVEGASPYSSVRHCFVRS